MNKEQKRAFIEAMKAEGLSLEKIESMLENIKGLDTQENVSADAVAKADATIKTALSQIEEKLLTTLEAKFSEQSQAVDDKRNKFASVRGKTVDEMTTQEKTGEFLYNTLKFALTKDPEYLTNAKALSGGEDIDGGHLVPEYFRTELIEKLQDRANFRAAGATVFPMSGNTLEMPKEGSRPQVSWGSENASIPTTTADFGTLVLTAHKMVARIYTSSELVEDSNPQITSILMRQLAFAVADEEDSVFTNGSGTGKPKGVLQETLKTIDAASALSADDLIRASVRELGSAYRRNAAWMMSRRVWSQVLSLKDSQGQYLVNPNQFTDGNRPVLLGYPVYENEYCGTTILFGDYSYYYIGDRRQVAISASTEADNTFAKDQLQLKVTERVAGSAALTEAFVKITNAL